MGVENQITSMMYPNAAFVGNHQGKNIRKEIRYQSHLTGKYRVCAHGPCNFTAEEPKFFPVVFQDSGYGCHLFYKSLMKKENQRLEVDVIVKTNESYISLTYVSYDLLISLGYYEEVYLLFEITFKEKTLEITLKGMGNLKLFAERNHH